MAWADKNDDKILKSIADQYELAAGDIDWAINYVGPLMTKEAAKSYTSMAKGAYMPKEQQKGLLATIKESQNTLAISVFFYPEEAFNSEETYLEIGKLLHIMNAQKPTSWLDRSVMADSVETVQGEVKSQQFHASMRTNLKKAPKYLLVYFEGTERPVEISPQFYLIRVNGEKSSVLGGPFLAKDLTLP